MLIRNTKIKIPSLEKEMNVSTKIKKKKNPTKNLEQFKEIIQVL